MTLKSGITRRGALKLGAAATALPLVHIRTAGAAGKLTIAFWDHWVPAGNDVMRKQVQAWADKNKVDVQADFITSNGFKNLVTIAAEAQAKQGHDIQALPGWETQNHRELLEPMDDVMKRLISQYGEPDETEQYLAKWKGHWMAVPTSSGNQNKGPCARISVLKDKAGLDVVNMYPARDVRTDAAKDWTWEAHLKAAEACQKAGMPFAIGLGVTADSVDTAGSLFHAYGAEVVNAKGEVTVDSDPVRQVLEYAERLVKVLPADAVSYDDASNNRALISGKAAMIWNPPSAYAVAKRDAPQIAADCWTFPAPAGPKGRFMPLGAFMWGVWKFAANKSAAKEMIEYLMQRDNVEARCNAVDGYDLPPFPKMLDFPVWANVEPPKGTVFNYPMRPVHDSQHSIACSPAPPEIAVQIYNRGTLPTMFAKLRSGQSIKQTIAWAQEELEGFTR
ncbi:MAG: extracellular solute-binding protein [Alphaproteobacteria bacterium]|nr:extracellular solute-binding protein [Alphaproteobacteria bacterium]